MTQQSLIELLAETTRLLTRFEATQPSSARISVLIRDKQRLTRMLADQVSA